MKKFFAEFKKFITRGNVVDMAVGVIVGSSFTAIVNALSNNILKPLINWILAEIFGKDSLSELYTFLTYVPAYDSTGKETADLTQSIYIDWGAFINAVLNFFIIAFVLFTIVKVINKFREERQEMSDAIKSKKIAKEDRKAMKAAGIKLRDKEAVKAYFDEKARKAEEERLAAEEKARLEKEANPSTEELLKQIRDLLQAKA
ncbi:MAG: large conductance mechanosensitive channel protein MscL [Clostridia bacterium]|nr:large conductance mechanosensitive channel protein MscL [Clostridia bacterium]